MPSFRSIKLLFSSPPTPPCHEEPTTAPPPPPPPHPPCSPCQHKSHSPPPPPTAAAPPPPPPGAAPPLPPPPPTAAAPPPPPPGAAPPPPPTPQPGSKAPPPKTLPRASPKAAPPRPSPLPFYPASIAPSPYFLPSPASQQSVAPFAPPHDGGGNHRPLELGVSIGGLFFLSFLALGLNHVFGKKMSVPQTGGGSGGGLPPQTNVARPAASVPIPIPKEPVPLFDDPPSHGNAVDAPQTEEPRKIEQEDPRKAEDEQSEKKVKADRVIERLRETTKLLKDLLDASNRLPPTQTVNPDDEKEREQEHIVDEPQTNGALKTSTPYPKKPTHMNKTDRKMGVDGLKATEDCTAVDDQVEVAEETGQPAGGSDFPELAEDVTHHDALQILSQSARAVNNKPAGGGFGRGRGRPPSSSARQINDLKKAAALSNPDSDQQYADPVVMEGDGEVDPDDLKDEDDDALDMLIIGGHSVAAGTGGKGRLKRNSQRHKASSTLRDFNKKKEQEEVNDNLKSEESGPDGVNEEDYSWVQELGDLDLDPMGIVQNMGARLFNKWTNAVEKLVEANALLVYALHQNSKSKAMPTVGHEHAKGKMIGALSKAVDEESEETEQLGCEGEEEDESRNEFEQLEPKNDEEALVEEKNIKGSRQRGKAMKRNEGRKSRSEVEQGKGLKDMFPFTNPQVSMPGDDEEGSQNLQQQMGMFDEIIDKGYKNIRGQDMEKKNEPLVKKEELKGGSKNQVGQEKALKLNVGNVMESVGDDLRWIIPEKGNVRDKPKGKVKMAEQHIRGITSPHQTAQDVELDVAAQDEVIEVDAATTTTTTQELSHST